MNDANYDAIRDSTMQKKDINNGMSMQKKDTKIDAKIVRSIALNFASRK